MKSFSFSEKHVSQIPALRFLIGLGYKYLPAKAAMTMRGGKTGHFLLEGVLREQLEKINRIHYKGGEHRFSEANIEDAVRKLKNIKYDGLQKTGEQIYDLLTLGTALEQSVGGDAKSFTLNYIDWKNPRNNALHVTAEFKVERAGRIEEVRPDIVLFVNGIPFVVIECKGPDHEVEEAISQIIRNQGDEYAPHFFIRNCLD